MSEAPHLLVEENGPVLVTTLNRPDKLNAMTWEMMDLFREALIRFRDNDGLKVLLIRATGRYFCAGADLRSSRPPAKRTASGFRENHRLQVYGVQSIYDEMEHIEKPIVVAHHAMCVGGGLELSLSCDFRLAARSAGYSFPETLMGMIPASNGVSRLTRLCGPQWAKWMIIGNKKLTSDLAFQIGLVQQVIPDETFEAEVMEFCQQMATQDSEQMGAAKLSIHLAAELSPEMGRHVERMANSSLMLNPGYNERMAQYVANVGGKTKG